MATLLNTWYGPWAGFNSSNHHRARIQLYRDSDTGSGYKMHWVWSVQVVRDTGSTYINASWTSSKYYASGTVNGYYLRTTGQQFTVAYGSSCTATGRAYYYSDTYGQTYASTASASYTVPKPTYAVTYDANGGTGAPGGQTKTYGTNLTLSSTRPTRTDYDFVGWGTTATATTAAYQPGDTYTGNAALKLYAVWRLNYIHPAVQGLVVDRCNSTGELADDGTYVRAYFGYAADRTFDATNVITTVAATVNGVTETQTVNQQSGSATLIVNAGISETSAYTVTVTVTDSYKGGTSTATASIGIPQYLIDVNPNGGIGFGMPADEAGVIKTDMPMKVDGKFIQLQDRDYPHSTPSSSYYGVNFSQGIMLRPWPVPNDDELLCYLHLYHTTSGVKGAELTVSRKTGGTPTVSGLSLGIDSDGNSVAASQVIGTRYTASKSVAITTANVDSYVDGPSLSLPPGIWLVETVWQFNTGSSSGSRNIDTRLRVGTQNHAEGIRVVAAANNFARLQSVDFVSLTANRTSVTAIGSSSMKSPATTCYMTAVRVI